MALKHSIFLMLGGLSLASAVPFGQVVPIGGHASDIALDTRRGLLYIANFAANRIDVMSTADNSLTTEIHVAPQPASLALSRDGRFLVVAHFNNRETPSIAPGLTILDLDGHTERRLSSPVPVLAVAFGADGRALVVSTQDIRLLEPLSATTKVLSTIQGLTAGKLPVPIATFPPEIVRAAISSSGDGNFIYGLGEAGSTDKVIYFRYWIPREQLELITITSAPPLGPRQISVNHDGFFQLAGWGLLGPRAVLLAQFNDPSGKFNIGSHVIDNKRGLIYAQMVEAGTQRGGSTPAGIPAPAASGPTLMITDADNLTIRERLQLPENLAGRSILSPDEDTMYSISDSGVTILPIGQLDRAHRVAAVQEDVLFRGNYCSRGIVTKEVEIVNPGGGNTPFTLATTTRGISFSPASGVTPARVTVELDFNRFQGTQGTEIAIAEMKSPVAVNIPTPLRILINNREPDQKGTFFNVPGHLADVLTDPERDRFYVLRQDKNQVLVFNAGTYELIATLRTGNTPTQMAQTFDRRYLLVGNDNSQIANVFDLDTLQPSGYIEFPGGHYPRSIAASGRAILAASRVAGPKHTIDIIDFDRRVATELPELGIYTNDINVDTVLSASPSGRYIFIAQASGGMLLYDGSVGTFTASRKDLTKLSGAFGVLSDDRFVADNNLFNKSLVLVTKLDPGGGTSSGLVAHAEFGIRTTSASAAGPGLIQRTDTITGEGIRPTRTAESPRVVNQPSTFTRTLGTLPSRGTLVSLSISGFTIFPFDYDAATTAPVLAGVVNAADGTPALAPGSLINISGQEMTPVTVAGGLPLSTTLGDTCVTVNGIPVPLGLVSSDRITGQLPFNVVGDAAMILRSPAGVSNTLNITINPGAPSVFRTGAIEQETGLATIYRSKNNQLVTLTNPIHPEDEIVIFLTGLGRTSPAFEAGFPAPSDPTAVPVITPEITLGQTGLPVLLAGAVPGEVGVYGIVAKVPFWAPTGMQVPLKIEQGGISTTLMVRVVK